jgi:hypothetical protein
MAPFSHQLAAVSFQPKTIGLTADRWPLTADR